MVNRRQVGYTLIAMVVVAFGCASLIGVEFSLLPQQVEGSKISQRAEAVSAVLVQGSSAKEDEDNAQSPQNKENEEEEVVAATKNLRTEGDQVNDNEGSEMNGMSGSREVTSGSGSNDSDPQNQDDQAGASTDIGSNSARSDNSTVTTDNGDTDGDDEAPSDAASESSEPALLIDGLMTPELIAKIEGKESDCLSPMHVHLLWIGNVNLAPRERHMYTDMGYNLTVHTDANEILEGFLPHVRRAFDLAIPTVVGYDFLKFLMLYKYGGLSVDADTYPTVHEYQLHWPVGCDLVFGKEAQIGHEWNRPIYRESGGNNYGLNRPFQILNWAMAVNKPRNPHIKYLIRAAMMHFFGRRDMEGDLIQDVSGSGLMSDYVSLLHEEEGRSYQDVYRDESKYVPVQGLCLTDGYLHGKWIHHMFHGTWKVKSH
ncbi:hypothetical protein Gpo141_00012321 [Globisporangium polare]